MGVRSILGILLAILICLLGACAPQPEQPVFRVGFIAPLTGVYRNLGASSLEGAEIALDEIEQRGGLRIGEERYRISLVLKDSENKPELAVHAAQELINHENVSAIIGPPVSALAIPVARLSSRIGVLMITQFSTHPDVTSGTDGVYRICFTDDFQGEVMARFAREQLRAENAAVLFDVANTYNKGISEIFEESFQAFGGKIVASETYITGEQDFREHLKRIAASRPEVLFLPNYINDIRLQMEQIRELELGCQIIGSDTMGFREAEDIARIEGAYFSTHFSLEMPDERLQAFRQAYRNKYQREPTAGSALTYDALNLLFHVAETEGSVESGKLRAGMASLERYEGITGFMEFLGSPDPRKSAVIVHVEEGEFRYCARIDP